MNLRHFVVSVFALAMTLANVGCGSKGDQGPAGPAGSGKVVATINCEGTVTGAVGTASVLNGLDIEYNAVLTSAGDVYATANVIDETAQSSGTVFYAANESGSSTAQVLVTSDYVGTANGGYWSVSLNRSSLITTIVYDDVSLASPVTMNFASSACKLRNF